MSETIKTKRCQIKPTTESDKPYIKELYKEPLVRKYLGGTIKDEKELDKKANQLLKDKSEIKWTVTLKETQEFIGIIIIGPHHDIDEQEISYQFLPEFWGKGLATETLLTAINNAEHALNLPSIIAETQKNNTASIKLLEKLGMSQVATVTRFNEKQVIYRKKLPS